jgi:hypothetical protein
MKRVARRNGAYIRYTDCSLCFLAFDYYNLTLLVLGGGYWLNEVNDIIPTFDDGLPNI